MNAASRAAARIRAAQEALRAEGGLSAQAASQLGRVAEAALTPTVHEATRLEALADLAETIAGTTPTPEPAPGRVRVTAKPQRIVRRSTP